MDVHRPVISHAQALDGVHVGRDPERVELVAAIDVGDEPAERCVAALGHVHLDAALEAFAYRQARRPLVLLERGVVGHHVLG